MSTAQKPESTAVTTTKRDKVDNFRSNITKFEPTLASVLSGHVTPERVIALTLTAATKNPALFDCTIESVALSLIQVAQWDLEIGRTAHLVPFGKTCTAIADWKGLVELMLRSGHVKDVRARPVYTKEVFNVQEGLSPSLEHFPNYNAEERGELMAFYAVAFLARNGGTFEVMTKADVETIRNGAASRNSDAWKNHFVEMGKKTVIRRLAKRMPQTPALHSALSTEDRLDAGDLIDAIQREERQIARPTYRAKHLPIAVRADNPYEVDADAPAQSAREAVHVTPAPRTEAQKAAAQAAAEGSDVYGGGDADEARDRGKVTDWRPGEALELDPVAGNRSALELFPMPFGPSVGQPMGDLSTPDLSSAYRWALKNRNHAEFVEKAAQLLDDRTHGDATEPKANG